MRTTRLLMATLGIAALLGAADASAARNRDQRHAGHRPRVGTATYSVPARPHARVLRMAHIPRQADERRFAQAARRHALTRGS